jgi:hypothetical protein
MGSPYVLYAPQAFPGMGLTNEGRATDAGRTDRASYHHDEASGRSPKARHAENQSG